MKRNFGIAAACALLAATLQSACSPSQPTEQQEQSAQSGAPDAKPGLSVSGARLVLPAVTGNPGAVYFSLANGSDKAAELAAVHVEGAGSAEIHDMSAGAMDLAQGVTLAPGETVAFAPGGKHVMVFDLADEVKTGTSPEMTLIFADGDKLSIPVKVETVGANSSHESGH